MKTVDELRDERGKMLDDAKRIIDSSDGSLSEAKNDEVNAILDKIEGVDRLIAASQKLDDESKRPANPELARFVRGGSGANPHLQGSGFEHGSGGFGRLSGLKNLATGQPIRTFAGNDLMAGRSEDCRIGESLFDWLRGDLRNSQVGGVDSAGGFLISPAMAPFVVDLARAASVSVRLGAQSFVMDGPETRIGTVTGDPSPQWVGELQAVTASSATFGLKTLRARKQVTLIFVSDEWMLDASNGPMLLNQVMARAMAADLDSMILTGSGAANEPLGITNDSGRNTVTGIGGIADFADPVVGVQKILTANYQGEISNLGWVLNPEIASDYQLLTEATTNAPLARPQWVTMLREAWTTALPTSTAIVGDFSQVLIGTRMNGVRFEVLNAGTGIDDAGDTLNAVSQVGRWLRMVWYGDSVILKPDWFTTLEGITT